METRPRLIVLGSSLTALAVARNAAHLRLRPLVFDTDAGIAFSSRCAERELFGSADEQAVERLTALAADEPSWLIATSDAWLRLIAAHRDALASAFGEILHPADAALAICLEKARFADWCRRNALPAPRCFSGDDLREDAASASFPLLLRPAASMHWAPGVVPKAMHVRNAEELRHWLDVYAAAGVAPLVTESLLDRPLTQYSVGASRRGGRTMAFVAVKRRPLPQDCQVGTYVELMADEAVEALARRALDALDFAGIGEVEILRDESSGRDYLIEINARPWVQYGLGVASGHDLLAFQLDPERFDAGSAVTSGKRWLNFPNDLFYCFSRSVGVVRHGRLPAREYVRSLVHANTFAHFAWTDPLPAWRSWRPLLRRRA